MRDAARAKGNRLAELTATVGEVRKAYTADTIATYLDGLSDEARQSLEDAFRSHLETVPGAAFVTARFDGGTSWHTVPVIRAAAVKFLPEHCPDFHLPSIGEFAKQRGTENFDDMEREFKALGN